MGTKYIKQYECHECRKLTHDYCDSCGKFICEEHRHHKSADFGEFEFIFCKECMKKGARAKNPATRTT